MTEPSAQAVPPATPATPSPDAAPDTNLDGRDVGTTLWQLLCDPWLLLALAGLLGMLLTASALLPQLPGQLQEEPAAADRWLTATTDAFGAVGPWLRSLGLFNVLHSPQFRVLLVTAIFVLLVQTANAVLVAVRYRRLPAALDQSSQPGGEPVPLHMPVRVLRWRDAFPAAPLAIAAEVETQTRSWATRLDRRTVRVVPAPAQAEAHEGAPPPDSVLEERLLGVRGMIETLLRPLLPVAMILALTGVWWNSMAGRQFLPSPLLPGERASEPVLGVTFAYELVFPRANTVGPVVSVAVNGERRMFPLEERVNTTLEGVSIHAQPGSPALLVRTIDESAQLARPGQANSVPALGLGFPSPGSEETLVLPQQGVGLRIIRQDNGTAPAADDSFVVEVFQGDREEPVQRFTVGRSQVERITTPYGEIPLGFVPMPMMQVRADTSPGLWLLLPALLLALGGLWGFRRRPAFLLAQSGPWPVDRAVLVIQTDQPAALEAVRQQHAERMAAVAAKEAASHEQQ